MVRWSLAAALALAIFLAPIQAQKKKQPAKPAPPAPAEAMGGSFTAFTATMSGGLMREQPKKVYRLGDLMRVDLPNKYDVSDLRKRITWVVHPDRCTLYPGPDTAVVPFAVMPGFTVERKTTDEKEIVDGHPCRIEIATYTYTEDPLVKTVAKIWRAEDLQGFPVRIDVGPAGGNVSTFLYSDAQLGSPDPKLFQLPPKCTDFNTGKPKKNPPPAKKKPDSK